MFKYCVILYNILNMISINKISKNLVKYKLYIILLLVTIIIFNFAYRYFNIFEYNTTNINNEQGEKKLNNLYDKGVSSINSIKNSINSDCNDYNKEFKSDYCKTVENFENKCNMKSQETPNFSTSGNNDANKQSRRSQELYQSILCKN